MGAASALPTVEATVAAAMRRLAAAGVPEARADAAVMLAHVLGTTRTGLVVAARRTVDARSAAAFGALVARRVAREPVQHLTGEREFWSLPFRVDRRVLVPRPETELVVETALRVASHARCVLDVGTGSGIIAAVLARELRGARVWASDRSADALSVARENLARHAPDVRLVRGDLLAPFAAGAFDLIVANPPYVPRAAIDGLAPEVRDYEPRVALDGGADGLDVLRALLADAPRVLASAGSLVLEMAVGQAPALRAAARDKWGGVETVRDHAGIERVLVARRRAG